MDIKTIVISAGHGGRDPGAVSNGLRESDVNLKIALACRDHLNLNYKGHRLILPRTSDVFVGLPERRDMAQGADLYVSIHNNAFSSPAARGFETFIHSGPLYSTTIDYRAIIHNAIYDYLDGFGVPDRGMKRYNHWVTREMPCPTVLVEYLFVTSPHDAALLKRPGFCEELGKRTAEGVATALKLPRLEQKPEPPQTDVWFRVIAGSYRNRDNAERMLQGLKMQGVNSAFLEAVRDDELR